MGHKNSSNQVLPFHLFDGDVFPCFSMIFLRQLDRCHQKWITFFGKRESGLWIKMDSHGICWRLFVILYPHCQSSQKLHVTSCNYSHLPCIGRCPSLAPLRRWLEPFFKAVGRLEQLGKWVIVHWNIHLPPVNIQKIDGKVSFSWANSRHFYGHVPYMSDITGG